METREDSRTAVQERNAPQGDGRSPIVDAHNREIAAGEEQRSGPRKRVIFITLGVIVLIVAVYFGLKWFSYARLHQSTDDARIDASNVQVNSKIGERVNQILVGMNEEVRKGQLLIVLDDRDERARLAQAQANYDLAIASQHALTAQAQGGVTTAQAQTGVARAALPAAQQGYDKALADLHRAEALVASGDVAAQQLDAARAAEAQAAAQLRGAENTVSSASGGVQTAQGKLSQSTDPSQSEAQKATLELAKQNLNYTKIYSPIDGYVGEKDVEVGQTVGAGVPLMILIPHNVFVTANFKETQMGNMHPGQETDVSVDAYKGVTFHGHVLSINPASQNVYALVPAQNATGNFVKVTQRIPVKISIDDPRSDMPLRPGMSVEASVKVK